MAENLKEVMQQKQREVDVVANALCLFELRDRLAWKDYRGLANEAIKTLDKLRNKTHDTK